MATAFFGQSIKAIWKNDISDSRGTLELHKIFEFLDDYTYGTSKKMGIYISAKGYLYLFMEKGPQTEESMEKLLTWRISGKSAEIGHKGGGNKRNIYGHFADKVRLYSRLDDNKCIYADTKPNAIYNLVSGDDSEETVRSVVNSSKYITTPDTKDLDELPAKYADIYKTIKTESEINPDYIIEFEIQSQKIPEEYTNKEKWTEFINEIGLKQYKIPILYKNAYLGELKYREVENIDLVGITYVKKEMLLDIYVNKTGNIPIVYFLDNNEYVNVVSRKRTPVAYVTVSKWGSIRMIVADKEVFKKNHKLITNNKNKKYPHNKFYGVYACINDKFTNIEPITSSGIPQSKNNGIDGHGSTYFRMILYPDTKKCTDIELFESILITNTIKALTKFTDNAPNEEMISLAMDIFKQGGHTIPIPPPPPVPKPSTGGCYVTYLGKGLCKYGRAKNFASIPAQITKHRKKGASYIKTYKGDEVDDDIVSTSVLEKWKTYTPEEDEQKICSLLGEICQRQPDKIVSCEINETEKESYSFFQCEPTFLIDDIIPRMNKIFS